jgi:hypothetical protein
MRRARAKVRKADRDGLCTCPEAPEPHAQHISADVAKAGSRRRPVPDERTNWPTVHPKAAENVVKTVTGLLRIARTALPDTYFATDTRVRRGQKLLAMFGARPVR